MMSLRLNQVPLIERVLKAVACSGGGGGGRILKNKALKLDNDEEDDVADDNSDSFNNVNGGDKGENGENGDVRNPFMLLSGELPDAYLWRLLRHVAGRLHRGLHVSLYLSVCESLLVVGGMRMKTTRMGHEKLHLLSSLRALHKALLQVASVLQVSVGG